MSKMLRDTAEPYTYGQRMRDQPEHIVLTIETSEPIEIGHFVKAFTSVAQEYRHHIKDSLGAGSNEADIYVRQIRPGSIIADLIPAIAPFISDMEKLLILEDFVRRFASRMTALISKDLERMPSTRAELQTYYDTVQAIANDPNGATSLQAAVYRDGRRDVTATFTFTTQDGRKAGIMIEDRLREINQLDLADHQRVLMMFTRSDIGDVELGKRSGELVLIESISEKPLALMYGASLAENRLKTEIRDADDNIFKKGFSVDVNVHLSKGKPVAYSVVHVHQVVDLPD